MQNQKGFCTGFKDFYGKEIHVGDKVVEACNLFVSTVCWDDHQGTYKLKDLGDYYIKDSKIEWIIIESFEKIKEESPSPYRLNIDEYYTIKNKIDLITNNL